MEIENVEIDMTRPIFLNKRTIERFTELLSKGSFYGEPVDAAKGKLATGFISQIISVDLTHTSHRIDKIHIIDGMRADITILDTVDGEIIKSLYNDGHTPILCPRIFADTVVTFDIKMVDNRNGGNENV